MSGNYKVVLNGKIIPGWEKQEVMENLARVFKTDPQKTARLISGQPTVVKKGVSKDQAQALQRILENAGADCEVAGAETGTAPPPAPGTARAAAPRTGIPTPPAVGGIFSCPRCGQTQAKGQECIQCGIIFNKLEETSGPAGAAADAPSPKSTFQDDLYAFIDRNQRRYMHKFARFREAGDDFSMTWNWATFFLGAWWLLYRKLYLWALIVIVVGFVPIVNVLAHIALSICGNYIYYRHARKKIREIRAEDLTGNIEGRLSKAGGVSWIPPIAAFVLILMIGFSIAIPTYLAFQKNEMTVVIDEAALLQPTFYTHDGGMHQAGSAFIVNPLEAGRHLLLTAHHLFSPMGGFDKAYSGNELGELIRKVSAKSIAEFYLQVETSEILPIPNAQSIGESGRAAYDLAVFPLNGKPGDIPVLTLAAQMPNKYQSVWLLAQIQNSENPSSMLHRARVFAVDDTGIAYTFDSPNLDLTATSGAPVLDADGRVVAINLGGILQNGKLVGFGNPATEIRLRIREAMDIGS